MCSRSVLSKASMAISTVSHTGIRPIGAPYFQERSRAARPRCLDRHYFHPGALWESHLLF